MGSKDIQEYGDQRPSWLTKQKSAMSYFHEQLSAIRPKWRQVCFYDLYDQGNSKLTDTQIAELHDKSREVINRWKHSPEYQTLCLIYSRAKYISLLPQALKTVEEMLESGAVKTKTMDERIRYKVAIDIIEKCRIMEDGEVRQGSSEKVGNINIFNLDKTSEDEIKDHIKNVTKNIEVLSK